MDTELPGGSMGKDTLLSLLWQGFNPRPQELPHAARGAKKKKKKKDIIVHKLWPWEGVNLPCLMLMSHVLLSQEGSLLWGEGKEGVSKDVMLLY